MRPAVRTSATRNSTASCTAQHPPAPPAFALHPTLSVGEDPAAPCTNIGAGPSVVEAEEAILVLRVLVCVELTCAHAHTQRPGARMQHHPDHDPSPQRCGFCHRVLWYLPEHDPSASAK
eukprot:CAMPEP_0171132010 /NCGR_PEP_ID=MMETSP0766_2-20121228/123730_1 /TAXON_ID=439317 /ORGANISM="Gambierdiscus australes, Strain CAWD 149" /LENGTH=118 /DNA_ID=CAMNT_0011595329 /DNA_START=28 /DNA_END=382 /DNA_ORIENTATION=+